MKTYRAGLLLVVLLAISFLLFAHSASALESTCPPAVIVSASPVRGETEVAVYSDTDKTERLGALKKGASCQIVGASGDYYRVRFDGIDGYAQKSRLRLKGTGSDAAFPGPLASDAALEQYMYFAPSQARSIAVHGVIHGDAPLDTLFFVLWDERQQQAEQVMVKEVKSPDSDLDISGVCQAIEFPAVTPGRKTLLIQAASGGDLSDVYRAPVYICGIFKAVRNINDKCRFSAGRNQEKMAGRSWTPVSVDDTLTMTLPEDGSAALMTIEWRFPAESFTVTFLDAGQNLISEETKATGFYADAVEIPSSARQARLNVGGKDNWVRNLCVYDANHPDNAVQQWRPLPEKLDLMAFSPHQDDELLYFGGAIPYACHIGAEVGVVYMANCGRTRYGEALDGLWTAGLRYHPIFMNWRDQWGHSASNALKGWSQDGTDPQKEVVRLIRRYKPEVVLGPDPEGEYGHAQHKLTSQLVREAVPLAMDESYDPDSAREYGVWEVKKVYLHLYSENRIELDWSRPFSPGSPISPIFLAAEAYDKHRSQQQHFSINGNATDYDNRIFGLYYTAVGPDEAKNDLFEHIGLE